MYKYFLQAHKLPEGTTVTKDLVTDANMALFLTWLWSNETSRQQVKKLQGYFKELRYKYKLVAPDSKSSPYEWPKYNRVLKGLQRTEKWKQNLTHKIALDEDQDNFIVSELCGRITTAAEDEERFDWVSFRQLVTYIILTDTASRPEFIGYLKSDGVKFLESGSRHENQTVKSRVCWLHTGTSKQGIALDKYVQCSCPEHTLPLDQPCSRKKCAFSILYMYKKAIPDPDSPNLKFMRNFKYSKKVAVGYLGKNGNMGYGQITKIYKQIGEMLSPPIHLTPGCGRTTGITLMARMGLSDSLICLTSGHKNPEVMRKNYLQAGTDQKSMGSSGVSFSRHRLDEEQKSLPFSPPPESPSLSLGDGVGQDLLSSPIPISFPSLPQLPVARAPQEEQEEVVGIDVSRPPQPQWKPQKMRRPKFNLRKKKRPRPKENRDPSLSEEPCFALSQPLPRSVSLSDLGQGGLPLQPLSDYNVNLNMFNASFPPPVIRSPEKPRRPPQVNNMTGTFNNCTFVMGKEN